MTADRLDPAALEATAVAATGLDDFGGDAWREPLARYVEAAEHEARLSPGGRGVLAMLIQERLVNRLEIADHLRRHPEVDEQEIEAPLVLATLPRTGQTAAGWILDRDPANRSLLRWFAKRPCPPPEPDRWDDDPRIENERALISLIPEEVLDMHLSDAQEPDECHWLISNDFRGAHEIYATSVPSYYRWVRDDPGIAGSYRYYATQLRLLQSRLPPARWVLKNSPHLLYLEHLHAVLPDAVFVQFHRDPTKVLASNCRLAVLLRRLHSDHVDPAEVGESMLGLLGDYVDRLMAFRRAGKGTWVDVSFRDFVTDPVRTIEQLYDRAGFTLTDGARTAMAAWVDDHPRHDLARARPAELEPYGLTVDRAREVFADYLDAFDVTLDGI